MSSFPKNLSPSLALIDLPNEILLEILSHVPTNALLHNCRLVSKVWKELATSLCRSRYVQLQLQFESNGKPDYTYLYTTFADPADLPWSCCHLQPREKDFSVRKKFFMDHRRIKTFVRVFGPSLKKVRIDGYTTKTIIGIIKGIPNVEEIELDYGHKPMNTALMPPTKIQLQKLRRLSLSIYGSTEVNFLSFLLSNTGARLDKIHLGIYTRDIRCAEKLSTLIVTVPSVFLCLSPVSLTSTEVLGVFVSKRVSVTSLDISTGQSPADTNDVFRLFEFAIQHFSTQLHTLKICSREERQSTSQRNLEHIRIPSLPVLVHLDICGSFWNDSFLPVRSPFSPEQFPRLESLKSFHCSNIRWGCEPFPRVTKLKTDGRIEPGRWDLTFPNLTTLCSHHVTSSDLLKILSFMNHLVHLEVHAWIPACRIDLVNSSYSVDLNAGLTGIQNPDIMIGKSEDEIAQLRTANPGPSLLAMTQLKTLKIFRGQLNDAVVHSTLLQIQPLQFLQLARTYISESLRERLHAYHHQVSFSNLT